MPTDKEIEAAMVATGIRARRNVIVCALTAAEQVRASVPDTFSAEETEIASSIGTPQQGQWKAVRAAALEQAAELIGSRRYLTERAREGKAIFIEEEHLYGANAIRALKHL